MATREELDAKRAARAAERDAQFKAQELVDDLALDDIEAELGRAPLCVALGEFWMPGLPTKVGFRLPKPIEFKRYVDQTKKDAGAALLTVADTCRVYPPKGAGDELYEQVRDAFPGVHANGAYTALQACQGKAASEGKG